MIELYGCGSPNVRKVAIMLAELDLPYSQHYVAVLNGAQFEPAFLALNPLGRVPVLVDPEGPAQGDPIFESGAILIYLAEAYGRPDLLPADGADRYQVMKWLMLQMGNIGPIFGQHNHFLITPDHAQSYAGQRYREQAARLYRLLDAELAKRPWLADYGYSIADIATYPWVLYCERHGMEWADLPHLHAWMDRIEARPAVQEADQMMKKFVADDAAHIATATQETFDRFFWRQASGPGVDLSPMKVS